MKINTLKTAAISLGLLSAQALFAQIDNQLQEQNSPIVQMSQVGVDFAPQMQMNPMGLDELNTLVDWLVGIRPAAEEVKQTVKGAGLEEDLKAAEGIKANTIDAREVALNSFKVDTDERGWGKKSLSEERAQEFANKWEAVRLNCEAQTASFLKRAEEVRQSNNFKSVALAHIAQVYEIAAEQAWLAERIYIAMANKKGIKVNKTALLGTSAEEKAKKEAAKAVLDKTVEIAKLTPPLRNAELFKHADAAWDRAKEAWNERISAQQQHETKDALLEKAKEAFENEKLALAEKTSKKHKTFLGKFARAAEGAGQALLNVNFLGLSPAFIPSVLGQVASAFNEKAIKSEFRKAKQTLAVANLGKDDAGQAVQNLEEIAPQAEMDAEAEEEHARDYYTKVARLAARSTTEHIWEKRVQASEQALKTLEAEGMETINSIKADFDLFAQKAKDARATANNAKTNLKEAQDTLAKAKEALIKWTSESTSNKALAINNPDAKMRLESEFIEATKNLNQCYESNNPKNSPEANALEKTATDAEEEAMSHLQAYLDQRDHLLRDIDRARSCLEADKAAWIVFWPEEALRKINQEECARFKTVEPTSLASSSAVISPNTSSVAASKVEVPVGKSIGEETSTVFSGMNIGNSLNQESNNNENTSSSELTEENVSSDQADILKNMISNAKEEAALIVVLHDARKALERVTAKFCYYTEDQGIITIDEAEFNDLKKAFCNNLELESLVRVCGRTQAATSKALAQFSKQNQNINLEADYDYMQDESGLSKEMKIQLDKINNMRAEIDVLKKSEEKLDRTMAPLMATNSKLRNTRNKEKAQRSRNLRESLQKELEKIRQKIEEFC